MTHRRLRGAARAAPRLVGAITGWALVVPSAFLATGRLTRQETRMSVVMAEALTPILVVPALAALGVATVTRRRALGVVAGALALLHLVWAAPDLQPARPLPDDVDQAPRLRLYSANLLFTNIDMGGFATEIRAARPDVVALQEVSPVNLARLEETGVLDDFPHRSVFARPDAFGTGVFSKLPLDDSEQTPVAGLPVARTTVLVGDHRVRLYDVHTRAPFGPGGVPTWSQQLDALRGFAEEEKGPLVLTGDFNATSAHRGFRELLGAGLRDAHVERGRGWVTTWPSDLRLLPPLARLDHVLVSDAVAVLGVREGTGRGSDHKPLVADLAVTG